MSTTPKGRQQQLVTDLSLPLMWTLGFQYYYSISKAYTSTVGGIPSTKLSAKPGLFCLAGLLSARVAFHERD